MEAASVVIRAAEAVALAEEMEALDPLRTVLEPGQATEADEPLTLGSAQFSPLMSVTFTKKNAILLRGKIVQILCFFSFAIVSPLPKKTLIILMKLTVRLNPAGLFCPSKWRFCHRKLIVFCRSRVDLTPHDPSHWTSCSTW